MTGGDLTFTDCAIRHTPRQGQARQAAARLGRRGGGRTLPRLDEALRRHRWTNTTGGQTRAEAGTGSGTCAVEGAGLVPDWEQFHPRDLGGDGRLVDKAIEDIEVGDKALATDRVTGLTVARPVVALIAGTGHKDLVEVTVDTDGEDTGTVIATDGHPFWVESLGAWVDAEDLRPGDMLRTSAGTWIQITSLSTVADRVA